MNRSWPPAEHEARVALAAAYRLAAHYRWDDLISTHLSAKVPGRDGRFLLNRRGDLFAQVTASRLVEVDLHGAVIAPADAIINPAGFMIHSAIHAAHPDVGCVIHLHARHGTAVSMLRDGLLPLSQKALVLQGRIAYHDYEGIALEPAERARLIADLGPHRAMILRNHGTLAVGATVAEAFALIYTLETACEAQVLALGCGRPLARPSAAALRAVRAQVPDLPAFLGRFGATAWPALLRMLDAQDPTYSE
jgi:ribulose-5-phosphate 4-epimerase/fuculose-1-phosphate aldolase